MKEKMKSERRQLTGEERRQPDGGGDAGGKLKTSD